MTRTRAAIAFVAATLLLFGSYGFNGLRIVRSEDFATFQAESDALVVNAVRAASEGGQSFGGFLVSAPDSSGRGASLYHPLPGLAPDARGRIAYVSQFGLHGAALAALAPNDPSHVDAFMSRVRLASSFLLSVVLAVAAMLALPRIGAAATAASVVMLACSPWLVLFARSPYWQIWSAFLPFVAGALVWRRSVAIACTVAFFTVLFRELMAYEYGTNIVLGSGLAIAIADAYAGRTRREIITRAVMVQSAAAAGLAVAIFAHVAKLALVVGSWTASIDAIRERLVARSYGAADNGFAYQTTGPFREFMTSHFSWCSVQCQNMTFMGRYLMLPGVAVPGVPGAAIPIGVIAIAALIVVISGRPFADRERRTWRWAIGLSIAASLSWAVAMPHHMLNHLHIDGIIWYLPFLPVAFAALARAISLAIESRRTARMPA